jgi:GTP-binding protein
MTERISRPLRAGRPARSEGGLLGRSVRLVLAGHEPGERPRPARPCLAILGRSNVGKSSLLNALLGVKVARVSQTPGRTQALYWYRVEDRYDVVDCPGYGFAKASRESRLQFSEMIESLLTADPRPEGALLLVDGRLPPQELDRSMALFLLESRVPTVVAATKWDAVKPSQRVRPHECAGSPT